MLRSNNAKYIYWYAPGEIFEGNKISPGGWYFSDEAELLNGPYHSEKEAIDKLNEYATTLNAWAAKQ